ncbi:MAG: sulfurtransferase [Betaproteobacteria bacterium]|nr:MAG: sulfurtransferase [Betaproteobacteria bacterium]
MNTTLVTAEELEAHLFDRDWCVVDCRHDLMDFEAGWRAYQAGHIPGATFANVEEDLSGEKTGRNGRHPLPKREDLVEVFRDWGIDDDTQIVAYDAHGGQFAVRLWWLARWLGHAKVAVLDGGWQAWLAKTNWSSTALPDRERGSFEARAPLAAVATADEVLAARDDAAALIVDARAPERFAGRVEPIDPVAGHIPGALNRFWQDNLAAKPDGRFKPPQQLSAEFERLLAGRTPAQMVTYCGSGVTSCHHLLAMEHAGLSGARLYAGSWSEWIADPSRPVVRGP